MSEAELHISWDRPMLERFRVTYKKAYEDARDPVNEIFYFEDNMFVLSYAKYLIEYLDSELPK